ncbi:MAG TPA: hypothetical protein PLZ05_00225 [Alphaproteobacteria bacterium]|nr:hypothetical protein [Alphaproteobacteria bacterium]
MKLDRKFSKITFETASKPYTFRVSLNGITLVDNWVNLSEKPCINFIFGRNLLDIYGRPVDAKTNQHFHNLFYPNGEKVLDENLEIISITNLGKVLEIYSIDSITRNVHREKVHINQVISKILEIQNALKQESVKVY